MDKIMNWGRPPPPLCGSPFVIYLSIRHLPPCHQGTQHLHFVQACPTLILSLCACMVGCLVVQDFWQQLYLRYNSHPIYPFK